MKLTISAIEAINKPDTRLRLALALGFSETWIRSLLADNKENGPLTTAKALQVIHKETGLTQDVVLVEEKTEDTKVQTTDN